ncbi:hypothetical protein FJZ33_11905, partial [Candidatus Poribacteria bacterium]|nr:hypothetical protein [Candidatus Poribacteria bacterium]
MIKGLKQKISYFEIFILLLFMFPLSFITVLAVENSTSDTQMAAESLTGGIKSDAVAAKNPFIIKSIEIQGSKTMPNETILGILQTRTGEEVQLKRIRDDVRELYKLGQFSNIQVDSSGSDEGISLKFIMEEWPKVKEVNFSGNH